MEDGLNVLIRAFLRETSKVQTIIHLVLMDNSLHLPNAAGPTDQNRAFVA
jgi:hypothetical protein